jgi:hypothetical protein
MLTVSGCVLVSTKGKNYGSALDACNEQSLGHRILSLLPPPLSYLPFLLPFRRSRQSFTPHFLTKTQPPHHRFVKFLYNGSPGAFRRTYTDLYNEIATHGLGRHLFPSLVLILPEIIGRFIFALSWELKGFLDNLHTHIGSPQGFLNTIRALYYRVLCNSPMELKESYCRPLPTPNPGYVCAEVWCSLGNCEKRVRYGKERPMLMGSVKNPRFEETGASCDNFISCLAHFLYSIPFPPWKPGPRFLTFTRRNNPGYVHLTRVLGVDTVDVEAIPVCPPNTTHHECWRSQSYFCKASISPAVNKWTMLQV